MGCAVRTMDSSAVHIVIVNYRTAEFAIDCLRTLAREREGFTAFTVLVVDNASDDGSAEALRRAVESNGWEDWARVLVLETNRGFAAGNNAGIRAALAAEPGPQYIMLLNPDTVVRPGAIKTLVQFLDEHDVVGIAGSRLEWPDGTPQRSARRFPSIAGEFEAMARIGLASRLLRRSCIAPPDPDGPVQTDWVVGAAMMIRSEVFETSGLLDEDYFLYFEEVDFCLAARRAGWPCWYVPDSRIVHLVGHSTGVTSEEKRGRCPRYWFESRARYFQKNHGRVKRVLADLAWASGLALHRVWKAVSSETDNDPPRYLRDFIGYNFLGSRLEP